MAAYETIESSIEESQRNYSNQLTVCPEPRHNTARRIRQIDTHKMKEESTKNLQAIIEENKSALRISKLGFQRDLGHSYRSQNRLSMHDLNYHIESSNPNQSSNINFAVTKSKLNDLRAKKKLDEELRLTTLAESMVFEDFVNTSPENPKFQQGPETKKYYQQKTMAHL